VGKRRIGLALGVCWLVLIETTKAEPPFVKDDPRTSGRGLGNQYPIHVESYPWIDSTVPNGRPDFAFNVGGSLKLNDHLNFIFTGGRDFVGDTHATLYLGIQIVTKVEK
jgi:hypothetical protein